MLINLSNHPSSLWSDTQLTTATEQYGRVVDIPFPQVSPSGSEAYIEALAKEYAEKVYATLGNDAHKQCKDAISAVHIMGEMTLTFAITKLLISKEITCIASTTERVTSEEKGIRTSVFKFVKFRKYV